MILIRSGGRVLAGLALAVLAFSSGFSGALLATCGPFTDVVADSFCPFVLEIFTLGITTGTTPTTYDPASSVTRLQMAAFLSRGVDGILRRSSSRAALGQFWMPQNAAVLSQTTIAGGPGYVQSDGVDLWVTGYNGSEVYRVQARDGRLTGTWFGAGAPTGIVIAMGRVLIAGSFDPASKLYAIDPRQPPGQVTTVASDLGLGANGVAFDGARLWTANYQSVSIVTPTGAIPWTVTNVPMAGTFHGCLYDGSSVWVTDYSNSRF